MFMSEKFTQTSSPISAEDLMDLINKIEEIKAPTIDRRVIGTIIKMVYDLALKKEELINLRFNDVIKDGIIHIGDDTITLEVDTKVFLSDYVSYLKEKRYKTTKKSPLFPQKDGKSYHPRKLQNDIKKFTNNIGLEKIRHAGICNHYEQLINQGKLPHICDKLTSEFARCSPRHTKGILTGQIQRAGRPKPTGALYYIGQIENMEYLEKNNNDLISAVKSLIKKIESDNGLSQSLKDTLIYTSLKSFCEERGIDTSIFIR